ncbi:MFS transporter [Streptomyces mirabilis]|uniref:MFS transporter n=1 Tax=Streptomyces TaxID=1883 RepID=UPI0029B5FE07|nr:MFS transporter [Streptomyces sp. AK02-04a]MDX3762079.1 MFS transporter [Streptomyces sp. AK02-04a]
MRAIGFLSFYDRFATAPMLVLLAEEEGVSLDGAVQLVTSYVLSYALGQPVWGLLADRLGRLSVLRLALVGTLLGSAASVAAPGSAALLVIRAMTGLFVGSLFPSVLTIVGDSYTGAARAREISSLQTFTALGTTAATLAAGGLAAWLHWRVVFALTAAGAALSLVLLRRVRFPTAKRGALTALCGSRRSWRGRSRHTGPGVPVRRRGPGGRATVGPPGRLRPAPWRRGGPAGPAGTPRQSRRRRRV